MMKITDEMVVVAKAAMNSPHCVRHPLSKEPVVYSVIETTRPFKIVEGPFDAEDAAIAALVDMRLRMMIKALAPWIAKAALGQAVIACERLGEDAAPFMRTPDYFQGIGEAVEAIKVVVTSGPTGQFTDYPMADIAAMDEPQGRRGDG